MGKGLLRVVFKLRWVSPPRISSRREHMNCKQYRREPQRGRIDAIHHLNLIDMFWFSSFCFELFGLICHLGAEGCWHLLCDCDWWGYLDESSPTQLACVAKLLLTPTILKKTRTGSSSSSERCHLASVVTIRLADTQHSNGDEVGAETHNHPPGSPHTLAYMQNGMFQYEKQAWGKEHSLFTHSLLPDEKKSDCCASQTKEAEQTRRGQHSSTTFLLF